MTFAHALLFFARVVLSHLYRDPALLGRRCKPFANKDSASAELISPAHPQIEIAVLPHQRHILQTLALDKKLRILTLILFFHVLAMLVVHVSDVHRAQTSWLDMLDPLLQSASHTLETLSSRSFLFDLACLQPSRTNKTSCSFLRLFGMPVPPSAFQILGPSSERPTPDWFPGIPALPLLFLPTPVSPDVTTACCPPTRPPLTSKLEVRSWKLQVSGSSIHRTPSGAKCTSRTFFVRATSSLTSSLMYPLLGASTSIIGCACSTMLSSSSSSFGSTSHSFSPAFPSSPVEIYSFVSSEPTASTIAGFTLTRVCSVVRFPPVVRWIDVRPSENILKLVNRFTRLAIPGKKVPLGLSVHPRRP